MLLAGGNNITLSQNGQSITISGPNVGGAQTGISGIIVSNTTYTSGTVSFSNANGISFGSSAGQAITASYTVPTQSVQTQSTVAVNGSTGNISIVAGNNISLSQNASTITISASNQSAQTQNCVDITLGGSTAGVLTLISSGTLFLAGGNNIVLSQNGQSVTISGPNTVAQTNQTLSLNMTSNTAGNTSAVTVDARSLTLQGIGIASVGLSTSAGGTSVIVSASQTVQTQNCVDVSLSGSTAGVLALVSSGTMILAGGNNIILSQNGQSITISGPNTVAQSNQTLGIYASSQTTGATSSSTYDARSLTVVGSNAISVGWTNGSLLIADGPNFSEGFSGGNTAGTTSIVTGEVVWAGGNNITLSGATAAGGVLSVTISAPNQDSQGISNIGNTSGNSGMVTGQMVLAGGNNVTLSGSTNAGSITVTISAPNFATNTNNLAWSLSGNSTSAGGGYVLISTGTGILAGGNNITLSQNGQSVTVSAGGGTLSKFFWPPQQALYSLSSSAMTNASASVQYVPLDQYISFTSSRRSGICQSQHVW